MFHNPLQVFNRFYIPQPIDRSWRALPQCGHNSKPFWLGCYKTLFKRCIWCSYTILLLFDFLFLIIIIIFIFYFLFFNSYLIWLFNSDLIQFCLLFTFILEINKDFIHLLIYSFMFPLSKSQLKNVSNVEFYLTIDVKRSYYLI